MRSLLILILGVSFLWSACSKKDSEPSCNTYYLSEEINGGISTKFFYNSDGQISSFEGSGVVYSFSYKNKILQKVDGPTATYSFTYNSSGKMVGSALLYNGTKSDSVEYIYDTSGHAVKRNFYIRSGNASVLYKYVSYEYTGNNPTQVDFYNVYMQNATLNATFKYTYDTHVKPYPAEYELFNTATSNTNSENNITSTEVISYAGQSSPKSETQVIYNASGYPSQVGGSSYKYACTPPTK